MEGFYWLETKNQLESSSGRDPFSFARVGREPGRKRRCSFSIRQRVCKSKPEVSCRQMVQFHVCVSKHTLLEGTEVGVK